jgi:hypothetical protein
MKERRNGYGSRKKITGVRSLAFVISSRLLKSVFPILAKVVLANINKKELYSITSGIR